MISRITSQTMAATSLRNLQTNLSELARLQDQASTRKAISKPSDDPSAAAATLQLHSAQRASEQYSRNIDDGSGWLTTVDSALASSVDILNRVRDLTVSGANDGAMSVAGKEAIAVELEILRDELLRQANSSYLGRTVFAGNSDAGVAFATDSVTGALTFTGAAGSTVQRRISDDATVRVDADGAAIFGTGAASVFTLIDGIAADLRSGVNIGTRLAAIDDRMKTVFGRQAEVGTRDAQLERAGEMNNIQSATLEEQRMSVEDVDLARVILDLKIQETSYQAALAVTARVLQPTLLDFLR